MSHWSGWLRQVLLKHPSDLIQGRLYVVGVVRIDRIIGSTIRHRPSPVARVKMGMIMTPLIASFTGPSGIRTWPCAIFTGADRWPGHARSPCKTTTWSAVSASRSWIHVDPAVVDRRFLHAERLA